MLAYLPSPKNTGLLDYYCNQNGTPIIKHETSSLLHFVEVGMSNLNHVTTLVIDLDALSDSDDEIISAIQSYRILYSGARVVVVALGRQAGDVFLDRLVREGIVNIITGTDEAGQRSEVAACLSDTGMTLKDSGKYLAAPLTEEKPPKKRFSLPRIRLPTRKEKVETRPVPEPVQQPQSPPPEPQPQPPQPQPVITKVEDLPIQPEVAFFTPQPEPATVIPKLPAVHKLKQIVTVGICGTQRRAGTTHQALMLCSFAAAQGLRAAYMESNAHNMTGYVREYYNTNTNQGVGLTQFSGIDLFSGYSLPVVLALGYDLYVFDYGIVEEVNEKDFLTNDIKVIVGGTKAWELPFYASLFQRYAAYPDLHFIMSFTPPDETEEILALMGRYSATTYFSGYSPSPWECGVNDAIYRKILHDYIQMK